MDNHRCANMRHSSTGEDYGTMRFNYVDCPQTVTAVLGHRWPERLGVVSVPYIWGSWLRSVAIVPYKTFPRYLNLLPLLSDWSFVICGRDALHIMWSALKAAFIYVFYF